MTITAPPARQLVTTNVLAMLRAAPPTGLGIRVGDNRAPAFGGATPRLQPDVTADYPYAILYDIDGGARDGDYAYEYGDAVFAYQLSVIGRRRDQAQLMADKAAVVICGTTGGEFASPLADPAGMAVINRDLDLPAGVQMQGTAEQLVWMVPVRFRIYVTTA